LAAKAATYEIVTATDGVKGIKCKACGRISWNPHDVREKYCNHCHRFHEEPEDA
jgi:hypothetical protein